MTVLSLQSALLEAAAKGFIVLAIAWQLGFDLPSCSSMWMGLRLLLRT